MNPTPVPVRAFTTRYSGLAKQLLTQVEVFPAFDPADPPDPVPRGLLTTALWDTGATGSCISSKVAQALSLTSTGLIDVNHAGGANPANAYIVNLGLTNRVGVVGVRVSEFPAEGKSFGVIIGMDIITRGDFSVTNASGKTVVSFRVPSLTEIDYVQETNRARFSGAERNAPCPCGKKNANGEAVKYKKCHGAPGSPFRT